MKRHIIFQSFLFCLLPISRVMGQEADSSGNKYGPLQENRSIFKADTSILEIDSTLVSDTALNNSTQKNWSYELYSKFLISDKKNSTDGKEIKPDRSGYFNQYNGKIIRKIDIEQLKVFGPSVYDTVEKKQLWFEKLGNNLHISTNQSSIRNHLFINENERIDAFILSDNERILRDLPSIQDARILIVPIAYNTDSVDIIIVTKDVWPIGFGLEVLDVGYGNVGTWNNNILGLGHVLSYTAYYDYKREPKYGYTARYRVPNIGNLFASLDLSHTDKWDYLANKVYLSRNIISPVIRLGGGIGYEKVDKVENIETIDTTYEDVPSSYEYYDFWAGYAFPLAKTVNFKMKKSIFISAREQIFQYFDRPQVERDYFYAFQQRKIFLSSVGFTLQGYQNTRLIYGFGDTEDLPFGMMIKLTGGYELGEFFNRYYMGMTLSVSKILSKSGFISSTVDFGGFIKNWADQGVLNYDLLYISPLLGKNKNLFRNFVKLHYEQGYNRYRDEYIEIGKNNGVRGLYSKYLKGDKRLYFNDEFVYFSPYHFYSFRFVFFTFIDAGIINYDKTTLLKNTPYSSLGIGIRVRNEKLVFNTLQLRFCYFPGNNNIQELSKQPFEASGIPKYRMPDFARQRPELITY